MKKQFLLKLKPATAKFCRGHDTRGKSNYAKACCLLDIFLTNGTVIVFGPVLNPNGGYGTAVVSVDNEEQLK